MKPVVRTLLVVVRDLVIVLGLLVWLARSDQMPQVVPPQLTDFLVDVSDIVFGSSGGGAGAAATDLADLALYGETDRNARRSLDLFRVRIENWFSRILDNVEGIVTHPLIRKVLPDFDQTLSLLFADEYLKNMVDRFADIDEVILLVQGGVILRRTRTGCIPLQPETVPKNLLEKARSSYGAQLEPLPGQRFLVLASFLSPMRERQGYVLVLLNSSTLKKMMAEYPGADESRLYLCVRDREPLIQSGQGTGWGYPTASALRHERFVDTGAGRKRNLAVSVRVGGAESGMTLGIFSPLANPDSLVMLGVRLLLLIVTVVVAVWLVRRLAGGVASLVHTHGLRERLLVHALDASLGHGKRMLEGARRIVSARPAVRRTIQQVAPARVTPPPRQSEETLPDFVPSREPDPGRFEQIHLDLARPVREGEFVIIDGPVELVPDQGVQDMPDFDPAEPAPLDD